MPTFMQNLASNPSGSGIYGMPAATPVPDVLGIVNRLKDREMSDFKDKANFMSDLSLRQDRLKRIYDVQDQKDDRANNPQNAVLGTDPNSITPYQKADLGIRQQGINLDSQKLGQQNKMGQEALDIKTKQEVLNQQKSDQINAQKQADMERKIEDSNRRLELAQQSLNDKTANAEAQLAAHKELAAAVEERHKLELAQKDAQFQKVSQQHQKTIDNLTEQLKQRGRSRITTDVNADGTKRTTTTERGTAADTINVIGKDGNQYTIPTDKMNDKDADGTPHWKPIGQDDQNNNDNNQNDNQDENDNQNDNEEE